MVVEPGVLLVRPADQPDVDVRVAVQLDVVPAVSVVARPAAATPLAQAPIASASTRSSPSRGRGRPEHGD